MLPVISSFFNFERDYSGQVLYLDFENKSGGTMHETTEGNKIHAFEQHFKANTEQRCCDNNGACYKKKNHILPGNIAGIAYTIHSIECGRKSSKWLRKTFATTTNRMGNSGWVGGFWSNLVFMNFKCVFCASFAPPQLWALDYLLANFVGVILVVRKQK